MSESDETRFAELWNDFLEGELSEDGMLELRELLESDEGFLKLAADSYQVHRMLGFQASESSGAANQRREAFVRETMKKLPASSEDFVEEVMQDLAGASPRNDVAESKSRRSWLTWAPLAASLLLAVSAGFFWLNTPKEQTIAEITGMSGEMQWTGDGGRVVSNLDVGAKIGGGTLEGLAPSSWVELTFDDGSQVTLSGNSMLTFSDLGQKKLYLRQGNLTANVAKQPKGRAMLIHTRSALLEVLGTQFNVEAGLSETVLDVSEGEVQLTRTIDKESVHVSAQQRAVASVEHVLEPKQSPNFVENWTSQLELGPKETFGKWMPADKENAARLKAIPFVVKDEGSDKSVTIFLAATAVSQGDSPPVLLQPNSSFEVRGNLEPGKDLFFGFQIHRPNGDFAGKFLAMSKPTWEDPDNPSSFSATFDTAEFRLDPTLQRYASRLPKSPAGFIVTSCWCFTFGQDGLELKQAEIIPSP
ncbi:MAG: FecR family protein [Planctomycetota bacterium]